MDSWDVMRDVGGLRTGMLGLGLEDIFLVLALALTLKTVALASSLLASLTSLAAY